MTSVNDSLRIYPVQDIDNIILSFLDPIDDYPKIAKLNKYYRNKTKDNKVYDEYLHFYNNVHFTCYDLSSLFNLRFEKMCENGYVNCVKYIYSKNKVLLK